jgi:hypothetical protein
MQQTFIEAMPLHVLNVKVMQLKRKDVKTAMERASSLRI